MTDMDMDEAKIAIINRTIDNFVINYHMAGSLRERNNTDSAVAEFLTAATKGTRDYYNVFWKTYVLKRGL